MICAFGYALAGIGYCLKTQRNMRIHAIAAVTVFGIGYEVDLTGSEWQTLILTVAFVFTAEMFNTAVEAVVNIISPRYHHLAKVAKDVAAGAVLIAAMASVIIGWLLFWPKFTGFFT